MTRTSRCRTLAGLAAGVLIAITGAACSAGSSDSGSSDSSGGTSADMAAPAAPEAAQSDAGGQQARGVVATDPAQQKVIATGSVDLDAEDVGDAAAEVRRIVASHGGTVGQDATETDDEGRPKHARLVVRVPVAEFADALAALKDVGTLVAADSSTEDVTTQVLDVGVRVEAERRSIDRIQELFEQATSITDIVKIENELATRQANLASLEQQQRYLADQTALSTIEVTIGRPADRPAPPPPDASGFLAGLSGGWHALTTFGVGAATVAGALLPWVVVLALLGVPTFAVVRRRLRLASDRALT
jgi:hypothetical protein